MQLIQRGEHPESEQANAAQVVVGEIEALQLLEVALLQEDIHNAIEGEFQALQSREGTKSICSVK